MKRKLKKEIVLIEGISPSDGGQDIQVLPEFFRMLGWRVNPRSVYSQGTSRKNKTKFLKALLRTDSRFVHISAHGNGDCLVLDNKGSQEARIELDDIKGYCRKKELADQLRGRFITISACGGIVPSFARGLVDHVRAPAVVTPLAAVDFHESALFAVMFYFTLLSVEDEKECKVTADYLPQYIDSFNRTKSAYLSVGGSGAYTLHYKFRKERRIIS